jgi:dienelactone hydrolase
MKKGITISLIVVGILAVIGVNVALFSGEIIGLPAEVKTALKSDDLVKVSQDSKEDWLVFEPTGDTTKGLIFYPESRMDPRTYAPVSRQIAEAGYLVVFMSRRGQNEVDLPGEIERIQAVMAAFPQVTQWALGAHTWGAVAAAGYAGQYPETLTALVFWAPRLDVSGISLADSSLPTLVIYGTRDEENTGFVEEVEPNLPPQTEWVVIEGGNRVSFASFGPMAADVGATISEAEQQSQAAADTLAFLTKVMP